MTAPYTQQVQRTSEKDRKYEHGTCQYSQRGEEQEHSRSVALDASSKPTCSKCWRDIDELSQTL